MFGDLVGLKLPDICLTGEEKPHPGNLSRPGIEPRPTAWQAQMLPLAPQRWTTGESCQILCFSGDPTPSAFEDQMNNLTIMAQHPSHSTTLASPADLTWSSNISDQGCSAITVFVIHIELAFSELSDHTGISELLGDNISAAKHCAITTAVTILKLHCILYC